MWTDPFHTRLEEISEAAKGLLQCCGGFHITDQTAHMSLQRSHGCAGLLQYHGGLGITDQPAPVLFQPSGGNAGLIRDYCLFVGGALATAVWFLHHHYWFLNIQIQTHGLRFLCQVILAGLLPATLLPGLVMRPGSQSLVGPLMLGQVRCFPQTALSLLSEPCWSIDAWPGEVLPSNCPVITVKSLVGPLMLGQVRCFPQAALSLLSPV